MIRPRGIDLTSIATDIQPALPAIAAGTSRIRRVNPSILLLLSGFTLVLWFYRTESIASDDLIYLNVARHYAGGKPSDGSIQVYARLAAWMSLRFGEWATGDALRAFLLMPMAATIASLWLVFRLAAGRWGRTSGITAAASLALCPLFLLYGSIWQPDIFAALLVLISLSIGLPCFVDSEAKRPLLRSFTAGALIVLGYSFKESAVLAGSGVLMFVALFRRREPWAWQRLASAIIGGFMVLLAEAAVLWNLTTDPLFHFRSIVDGAKNYGTSPIGESVLWYLAEYPRWLLNPGGHFGWWGPIACALVILSIRKSTDDVRLLICILAVTLAYMTVGSINLLDYQPMFHQPRYLILLIPIAALVMGAKLGKWRAFRNRPLLAAMAGLVVLGQTIVHLDHHAGRPYAAGTFIAGKKLIDRLPPGSTKPLPWCASGQTAFRLQLIWEQNDWPPITIIERPPSSRSEWLHLHHNAYVLVSDRDRRPDRPGVAALSKQSLDALATWPIVMSAAPDRSRIAAALRLANRESVEELRIDVFQITESPDD
jgi:hypothetical protein